MNLEFIEQVVLMLKKRSLSAFEFEQADTCLRLTFGGVTNTRVSEQISSETVAEPKGFRVLASGMGILRLTHPQQSEPFVAIGATVQEGQILAFLQAGALLHEVFAQHAGILVNVLAGEGDLIGFAQPLFELH